MAVDKSIEYYKDKTSTISFADGISCDHEEKTHPEAFGENVVPIWMAFEEKGINRRHGNRWLEATTYGLMRKKSFTCRGIEIKGRGK